MRLVCEVGVRGVWTPEPESPVTHKEPLEPPSQSTCAPFINSLFSMNAHFLEDVDV